MKNDSLYHLLQYSKNTNNPSTTTLEQILFSIKHVQSHSLKQKKIINSIKEELILEIKLEESEEKENLIASYEQSKKSMSKSKQNVMRKQTTDVTSHMNSASHHSSFIRKKDPKSMGLKEHSIHRFILKSFLWDLRQHFEPLEEEFDKRISLFYFLIDFLRMKEDAKNQIMILEKHRDLLSLEQDLELVRMKQILTENGYRNSGEKTLQVLDTESIKRKMLLRKKLEKATFDYHNLWSTLREITPDIKKVKNFLLTSFSSINQLKKFWENNFSSFSNDISSLMLYSTFLKSVLKRKQEGDELLKRIEIFARTEIKKRNEITEFDFKEEAKVNSSPICLIQNSSENLIIKSCNNQFSLLFCYTKQELIGKNFLQIISSQSLDFYLKRFHLKGKKAKRLRRKEELGTKRLLIFKSKTNFLRSLWALIKMVENHGRKTLVLKIDMERVSRPTAEILTNLDGKVRIHNESVSQVFNLEKFFLVDYNIGHLGNIAEEFYKIDYYDYFEGGKITFFNLINKEFQTFFLKVRKLDDSKRVLLFNFVKIFDFQTKFSSKTEGFLKKTTIFDEYNDEGSKKLNKFYFSLNKKLDFEGKYYLDENEIKSNLTKQRDFILNRLDNIKEVSEREIQKDDYLTVFPLQKKDYKKGIRVRRLFENRICDIFEFDEAEFEDEELLNESRKVREFKKLHEIEMDKKNIPKKKFKRKIMNSKITEKIKKNIINKLSSKNIPSKVNHLIIMNILILLITVGAFFINTRNLLQIEADSEAYIEVFSRCPIRNEYTKFVFLRVFDLSAINDGIHPYYKFRDVLPKEELMKNTIDKFKLEIKKMDQFWKNVSHYYQRVNAAPMIHKYLIAKGVKVHMKGNDSYYAYDDFFEIVKSAASSVLSDNIDNINFKKQELFFLERNMYNFFSYSRALTKKIKFERDEVVVRFQGFKEQFFNIFLILSVFTAFVLIILNLRVLKFLEKRIKIFYSFEDKYMKKVIKKCENYLIILYREQSNEDELQDDNSTLSGGSHREFQEYENDEKEEAYLFFRKKKKSKGNLGSIFNIFTFQIIAFICINLYIINLDLEFKEELVLKLKGTSMYILAFGRIMNKSHFITLSLSAMMRNPTKKIGGTSPQKYYDKNLGLMEKAYKSSFEV